MTPNHWLAWAAICFVASMIGTTIRLAQHGAAAPALDFFCVAACGLGLLLLARFTWEDECCEPQEEDCDP
jgi:hypothetical protein